MMMHHQVTNSYHVSLVLLSFIIALLASYTALKLAKKVMPSHGLKQKMWLVSGAIVMGLGIGSMHFIAMMAYPLPQGVTYQFSIVVIFGAFVGLCVVAFGTILILAKQMALKGSILESAIDCIMMFDHRGTIIEFNPAAEETFGLSRKDVIGCPLSALFFPGGRPNQGVHVLERFLLTGDDSILGTRMETTAFRSDRNEFPVEIAITEIKNDVTPIYTAYLRDLTEKKRSEETIQRLAYYDMLTGLPNRNLLNQLFLETMEVAGKHEKSFAVLFLDIDRFKLINDTLGHPVGDHLLQKFSALLSGCRKNNSTVSRLSGDEFVILFPEADRKQASALADNIIHSLAEPFEISGQHIFITTSIGIALYPNDGELAETLLKNADSAMYAAKERGKNNYQFFERQMNFLTPSKTTSAPFPTRLMKIQSSKSRCVIKPRQYS